MYMETLQNLGSLPIFILMFVIIYFLMIRPQARQQKNHTLLVKNLKKGDKVIMSNGIFGKVIDLIDNDKIIIETANESKILILKSHVSSLDK